MIIHARIFRLCNYVIRREVDWLLVARRHSRWLVVDVRLPWQLCLLRSDWLLHLNNKEETQVRSVFNGKPRIRNKEYELFPLKQRIFFVSTC